MNKSVLSVALLLALAGCSCSNQAEKQDENQTEDDLTKVERHFEEFHIEGIYDGTLNHGALTQYYILTKEH